MDDCFAISCVYPHLERDGGLLCDDAVIPTLSRVDDRSGKLVLFSSSSDPEDHSAPYAAIPTSNEVVDYFSMPLLFPL